MSISRDVNRDAPPWVKTTDERRVTLESQGHLDLARRYHAKFVEVLRRSWSSKHFLKSVVGKTQPHARINDQKFIDRSLEQFLEVATYYDFRLDQREWESLDDVAFYEREIYAHTYSQTNGLFGSAESASACWPTGTYFRYAQLSWLRSYWIPVPAFPDHMLSLAGYVLTTSARNLAPLTPDERLEFLKLERGHITRTAEGKKGDLSPKQEFRLSKFLERMPSAIYLPIVDVDCSDKCPAFDKIESPKRAVDRAVTAHVFITKIFGSLKWKLSNRRGGLHGIAGILPPNSESTDLLPACDWWLEKECLEAGIPTITTVDHETKNRKHAEIFDTTPFHRFSTGRGGMYRTPGNTKTDQDGKDKPDSVPQEDVELYVDQHPWLEPLTTRNLGEPFSDFSGLPQILADYRAHVASEEVERRKSYKNLKPGEPIPSPRMTRPKLELGGEPLLRTAEKLLEVGITGKLHHMRVAVAGMLLFQHSIPAQAATATLLLGFPGGQPDAIAAVTDTLARIRSKRPITSRNALAKLIGKEKAEEVRQAILWDEQERVDSESVSPLTEDELLEAFEMHELYIEEEKAEGEKRLAEAKKLEAEQAEALAEAEQPTEPCPDGGPSGSPAPKPTPKDPELPSILAVAETFWDPRDYDIKKSFFPRVTDLVKEESTKKGKANWKKAVWGASALAVQAGIARGVFYRTFLKAGVDGADRGFDLNKEKIQEGKNGVGGVWTLRSALGAHVFKRFMEALAADLRDLDAPFELQRRVLKGHSLTEFERFFLDGLLIKSRLEKLQRSAPELSLERILRCETFGANHQCEVHGDEVCYFVYVCKRDTCRHCRYHREKAKRLELRRTWPKNEKWWINKIPIITERVYWKESVEIGDDGLPRPRGKKGAPKRKKGPTKRVTQNSISLRDRVRQSYYLHSALQKKTPHDDRWPGVIPHKAIMGIDHAIVVAPGEFTTEEGAEIDPEAIERLMGLWGLDNELCCRDEAIDRVVTHQYTIGVALDDFILSQGLIQPKAAFELDPDTGEPVDLNKGLLSWLAKGTKTIGGNAAGKKYLPWPTNTRLQAILVEKAQEARKGLKVKLGECPVVFKTKDEETGEEVLTACAMKCRIRHEKTLTGEIVQFNSHGRVLSATEVWALAEKILQVEDLELQAYTWAERFDAIRRKREKKALAAASSPPK